MKHNIFTTKLIDIILPVKDQGDLQTFTDVFIVMDYVDQDLSSLFSNKCPVQFTEQHLICIMYNLLCSIKFLETANIMHRDIKPGNILVNDRCGVQICDFGLARTLPNKLRHLDSKLNFSLENL